MKLLFTRTHNNEIDIREIECKEIHYFESSKLLCLYGENRKIEMCIFIDDWEKIVLVDEDGHEHILKNTSFL